MPDQGVAIPEPVMNGQGGRVVSHSAKNHLPLFATSRPTCPQTMPASKKSALPPGYGRPGLTYEEHETNMR